MGDENVRFSDPRGRHRACSDAAAVAACTLFLTCTLGRSISMREALRVWQGFYCEGEFARCERYKLASAGREIPEGLLPNGRLQDVSAGSVRRPATPVDS